MKTHTRGVYVEVSNKPSIAQVFLLKTRNICQLVIEKKCAIFLLMAKEDNIITVIQHKM